MNRFYQILLVSLILTASVVAQDRMMSYQGLLTDEVGTPVADDFYMITFRLFTSETGGIAIWTEQHSDVQTTDGKFGVLLGSYVHLSETTVSGNDLFLEVQVGADDPMTPRAQIGSVPKAMTASRVDGDIQTGNDYTHFKASDGTSIASIVADGKGGAGRLMMYNPSPGFEGQPLMQLNSDADETSLELYTPGDFPPDPCIRMGVDPTPFRSSLEFRDPTVAPGFDPYIRMGVEPSPFRHAKLEFFDASMGLENRPMVRMGVDPEPFRSASISLNYPEQASLPPLMTMNINSETSVWQSQFSMFTYSPDAGGGREVLTMNATPGSGASIYMFNPQPEPPGGIFALFTETVKDRGPIMTMEITDPATDIQTKITPGRVKVGSDVSDLMARGEWWVNDDTCVFSIQGPSGPGPTPIIAMLTNSIEAKMGINTTAPSEALHVDGNICYTGTIGACSDGRYKEDVYRLEKALDRVDRLRGVNYRWRVEQYPDRKFDHNQHVGFIAQEVQEVIPEVVQKHSDGTLSVDYGRLTPLLVEAIKELKAENEVLRKRLDKLENN